MNGAGLWLMSAWKGLSAGQFLVDSLDEGGKFLFVIEAGGLDDASVPADEDVACDTGLAVCIEGEDVGAGVECQGVGDVHGFLEGDDLGQGFVPVDSYEKEGGTVLVFPPYFGLDMGHFFPAYATPAGRELEHDDLPAQLAERYAPPVGQFDGEVGSHVAHSYDRAYAVGPVGCLSLELEASQQEGQCNDYFLHYLYRYWCLSDEIGVGTAFVSDGGREAVAGQDFHVVRKHEEFCLDRGYQVVVIASGEVRPSDAVAEE